MRTLKLLAFLSAQSVVCSVFADVAVQATSDVGAPAAAETAPVTKVERVTVADPEKLQRSDESLSRMRAILKNVLKLLEDARREKDVVKLNCVNEKLTQIKGLLRVSEQASIGLQEAAARKDADGSEHEFAKINIAKIKVEQLRAESEECIGQLAYVIDEKTTVEVEAPTDLPNQDVTDRAPPAPPPSRPPPASPY